MSDPYATDDWKAFVAKIAAAGQDDTPRMVAADWLDDAGEQDRAELIRVQCELARLEAEQGSEQFWESLRYQHATCEGCSPWCRLNRRQGELIGGNYGGDLMDEGDPCQSLTVGINWKRGFVHTVCIDWPGWREHGDAILERHPVEVVTLTGSPDLQWHGRDGGIRNHRCSIVAAPRHFEYEWSRREMESFTGGRPAAERASSIVLLGRVWPADPDRPRIKFDLPQVTLGQDRIGDFFTTISPILPLLQQQGIRIDYEGLSRAHLYAELRERAETDARLGHSDDRVQWMTQPGLPRTLDIQPLPYQYEIVHECPSVRPWTLSAAAFLDDPIRPTAMYQTVSMTCRPYQLIQSGGRLLATHYFYAGRCAGCSTTFLMEARESPTRTGGTR